MLKQRQFVIFCFFISLTACHQQGFKKQKISSQSSEHDHAIPGDSIKFPENLGPIAPTPTPTPTEQPSPAVKKVPAPSDGDFTEIEKEEKEPSDLQQCVNSPDLRKLDFEGSFESGKITRAGEKIDGFFINTLHAITNEPVGSMNGGGKNGEPNSNWDTRVVTSELVQFSNGQKENIKPREGQYFLRSAIYYEKDYTNLFSEPQETNKPRSSIGLVHRNFNFNFDEEGYLGFSIFTPKAFEFERNLPDERGYSQLVTANTNASATFFSLSHGRFNIKQEYASWIFMYNVDAESVKESKQSKRLVDLGKVESDDIGQWTDFVIRYRANPFATNTNPLDRGIMDAMNKDFLGNKGILQVWKSVGPTDASGKRKMKLLLNLVNKPVGLVPHKEKKLQHSFRIYKYGWHNNPTTMVGPVWYGFDSIRFGSVKGAGTGLSDVIPGSGSCLILPN